MTDQALMVLRSFHIPPEMDDALRTVAFKERRTKAEVIRTYIEEGLRRSMGGNSKLVENLPDSAEFARTERKVKSAAVMRARRVMVAEEA